MKPSRWAVIVLLALLAGLLEATFFTFLPSPWRDIRPILDLAVLLVVINRPSAAVVFAAAAGCVLDAFPVDGSAFAIVRFPVVVLVVLVLSQTVLTNRSVYATGLLILAARITDRIWLTLVSFVTRIIGSAPLRLPSLPELAITVMWDLALVSLSFILIAVLTRRFLVTGHGSDRYDER